MILFNTKYTLLILICIFNYLNIIVLKVNALNECSFEKVEYPTSPVNRVILRYKCTTGSDPNPIIPSDTVTQPSDFNELDLSPNLFTVLPSEQLCKYSNLYQLDLSQNQIFNMTERFKTLSCLTKLTRLDLSSNAIRTPLLESDFDDTMRTRLRWLSLSNNRIPSLDSNVFMFSNGTTKFPNLSYLDLSYNLIKVLDVLWPMSIPNSNLFIDLSTNPIDSFQNQLNAQLTNNAFIPMIGNRSVDVTDNNIVSFDDSLLLKYPIGSSSNFRTFLAKLSNFDFRQAVNKLTCICPASTGLYTVFWYKQIASTFSSIDQQSAIFQLSCSNLANRIVFDFNCTFIGTTTTTSTTTTTTTVSTSTSKASTTIRTTSLSSSITTNNSSNSTGPQINEFGQLIGGQDVTTNNTRILSSENKNNYYLLFLLLIPVTIFILILFLFVCGRSCMYRFYHIFSFNLCPCFRPHEMSKKNGKIYDSVFCYSDIDENWIEEIFIPTFSDYDRGYKIHKIKIDPNQVFTKDQIEILKSTRRIVIIFSEKFNNEEWKNNVNLKASLKEICQNDSNLILVPINIDIFDDSGIKIYKSELNSFYEKSAGKSGSFKNRLIRTLMRNTGLEDVESLDWNDDNFWKKFNYIMPLVKNKKRPTEITETSKYKRLKKNSVHASDTSLQPNKEQTAKRKDSFESIGKHRDSFIIVNNELPLITNLKNSTRRDSKSSNNRRKIEPSDDERLPRMNMNSFRRYSDEHPNKQINYSTREYGFGPKEIIPINLDLERLKDLDTGDRDFWRKIETLNPETDTYAPISDLKDKNSYVDRFGVSSIDAKRVNKSSKRTSNSQFQPKSNESTNFRSRSKSPINKKLLNLDLDPESGTGSASGSDTPKSTGNESNRLLIIPTGVFTQLGRKNSDTNIPSTRNEIGDKTIQGNNDKEFEETTSGADFKVDYETYGQYDASDIQTQPKFQMPKKRALISAENKEIEFDVDDNQINNNENNHMVEKLKEKKITKKVSISDKIDYNNSNTNLDDQFKVNNDEESKKKEKKKKKKSKSKQNKANDLEEETNDEIKNVNNSNGQEDL